MPQKLSNSLHGLIHGHVHHDMFCKMVTKDQKVHHVWWLIQLKHGLSAGKVNMQELQRCSDNDRSHGGFGTKAFMLDALLTAANHPLHLSSHTGAP